MSLLWMWMATASAGLSFEADTHVYFGKDDKPSVTLVISAPGKLEAAAVCGDRRFTVDQPAKAGDRVPIDLGPLGEGVHDCKLSMALTDDTGAWKHAMDLKVVYLRPIAWEASLEDEEPGLFRPKASRALTEARFRVIGERGKVLAEGPGDLADPTTPVFRWDPALGEVAKIVVDAKDTHTFESELTIETWSFTIPHEDVVFATNSHVITAEEAPKLEATLGPVNDAIQRFGSVVDIHLYIGGYTDTVGDPASNMALSERRARAIAQWFRRRGYSGPISYRGFGESVLAVQTDDGVDSASNRRAVYHMSATAPSGPDFPPGPWKRL